MEEKFVDLTKILKVGDRVYSPLCGYGTIKDIKINYTFPIIVCSTTGRSRELQFTKCGRYFEDSEVLLFPSDECRNWDGNYEILIHPPKKGDYLVSYSGNPFIYNGKGRYGRIVARVMYNETFLIDDCEESNNFTQDARYATTEEIESFDKFLKSKGYYFDKEKLELKKLRWRAECGERYWFINSGGIISTENECNVISDNKKYDLGNYFKTLEDAEKALKQVKQLFKSIHDGNN